MTTKSFENRADIEGRHESGERENMKTPYASIATDYLFKGWDILPLPERSKFAPPKGYTGLNAKDIDEEIALGEWMDTAGNIGLRLPSGVVGIDIDAYKDNGLAFNELVQKLGPLPETMGITSRSTVADGVTLFFSSPKGTKFIGSVGTVDIIQNHHRYAVAPPSIHPEGRVYRWVSSSGLDLPWVPEPEDFPALPEAWVEFLQEKKTVAPKPELVADIDFSEFMAEDGKACKKMNSILKGAIIRLKEKKSSRHDLMVLATWAMTGEAGHGHTGYDRVLIAYQKAWEKSFPAAERASRPLPLEFESALRGAQRKLPRPSGTCRCNEEAQRHAPQSSSSLRMWR